LLSKDKKGVMIGMEREKDGNKRLDGGKDMKEVDNKLKGRYVRGNEIILDEMNKRVEEGLKRSEIVTLVVIVVMLFLVFR
ncbi:MMPL family transporter, partial [Staphylococcus pettenkoferi]|uniref:MMPL family transporter n=1 Tax=Staphylococcus pettenkoferi TaxID=170573 RepID=UPI0016427941